MRPPGGFSPSIGAALNSRSALSQADSSSSTDDLTAIRSKELRLNTNIPQNIKASPSSQVQAARLPYVLSHSNNSASSLQSLNFSRPSNQSSNSRTDCSPRAQNQASTQKPGNIDHHLHRRKNSATQNGFESYAPTGINLGSLAYPNSDVNTSNMSTQAAVFHQTHMRRRSQTVPSPGIENINFRPATKFLSKPPMLSLTEAHRCQEATYSSQVNYMTVTSSVSGNTTQIITNPMSSRSPAPSPGLSPLEYLTEKDKPVKNEKSKVKLFSRPNKIVPSKDKDVKIGLLPSPNMINYASLQRVNYNNLSNCESHSSASSIYSSPNSSSATIRPLEGEEKKFEKEKSKHNFLSRQKHKLTSKDDYNFPLSSVASNSKPMDPNAPNSLYNFNMPLNPSIGTTSFSKSMSGLDLRHGGRALRDKKKDKEEKSENSLRDVESSFSSCNIDKNGASNVGHCGATSYLATSSINYATSICGYDASSDIAKYGLDRLGSEDLWLFLRSKLSAVFEGEDLRLPVEDLNRIVLIHLQAMHRKRAQIRIVDDLKDLLQSGFTLLDQTLRSTPEEQFILQLVEMWIYTFTAILPFMQAVFLPFDLELANNPPLDQEGNPSKDDFCIRSVVLRSFRDVIILSRFNNLKSLFDRLYLDATPHILNQNMSSPFSDISPGRPATAMSFDPSIATYGSQNNLLVDSATQFSRNHHIIASSELSGSRHLDRDPASESNEHHSTNVIGRLLQCICLLNSVQSSTDETIDGENIEEKMGELARGLKINWLEKERMGYTKRALIGAKVRVPVWSFGAAIEV